MTRRPVWFLDVDGVVSPMGLTRAPAGHAYAAGTGWAGSVLYRPDVVARIGALHTGGVLEVRWLTSWEDDAVLLLAPALGLPAFEAYRPSDVRSEAVAGWWKAQVVSHFLATSARAAVWTDDEISERFTPGHLGFDPLATDPRPARRDRLLAICPRTRVGLTMEDVDRVEAFAHAAVHAPTRTGALS